MGLIKCPECGKEISDKADICVNCGFPIKKYLEEKAQREAEEEIKKEQEEKLKEKYWCPSCHKQNEIGADYCAFCGFRLTPYVTVKDEKKNELLIDETKTEVVDKPKKEFHGIYRYSLFGGKQEVYCPRCGSENCSYYTEQQYTPAKTKTRYTANLNPLHPFTLVNKKEKVIRKESVTNVKKIMCNDCGYTF